MRGTTCGDCRKYAAAPNREQRLFSPTPSQIPVSQGKLKNLIRSIGGRRGNFRIEPKFDGLLEIAAQLIEGFTLGDATGQRGNLRPKSAFFRLMNNGLDRHTSSVVAGITTSIWEGKGNAGF